MIENIEIDKILIDESRFSMRNVLFISEERSCDASFDKFGILNPVIVQKDGERFHLIDGRGRIKFAERKGITNIHASVLPERTPAADIIMLILCDREKDIRASVINRLQFISFALGLQVPEKRALDSLCSPLGLPPHAGTLRSSELVHELPEALRVFCHEKKFSLKQIVNLTSYPDDLTDLLAGWIPLLQLTASTMDEMAANMKNWLRSNRKHADDLRNDPEIMDILNSSMGPRDKTEKLRSLLRSRQFPVLTDVNAKIEKTVSGLKLPEEVRLEWDRTLENKNAGISIRINDPRKWDGILKAIGSEEVRTALEEILDEI